jgi:hypothetical protein
LLTAGSDWIEVTEALDVATIAPIAMIGDDDVIERTLQRPTSRKTYRNHIPKT